MARRLRAIAAFLDLSSVVCTGTSSTQSTVDVDRAQRALPLPVLITRGLLVISGFPQTEKNSF